MAILVDIRVLVALGSRLRGNDRRGRGNDKGRGDDELCKGVLREFGALPVWARFCGGRQGSILAVPARIC